mmetsp:Transcript_31524/g.22826  ORF Transcript_31524/g.22826 Transcript_31524/m.22826 type:complete len:161 (+) Transcript_31524:1039-1521(+)
MTSQVEYMSLLVNYSVYRKLFQIEDSKIYQKIWALQKYCPIIILQNNMQVNPGRFLTSICPLKKKVTCDPKDVKDFLSKETLSRDATFSQQIQQLYMRLIQWITKMNSDNLKDNDSMKIDYTYLETRSNLIIEGIKLATEIKRTLKSLILLYTSSNMAIK